MSMPSFPEPNPEITCDSALNMILTSIALEELALSHIINAEGEKLQYVLGTLESSCGDGFSIEDVLAVNKSVTCLMDSISQSQMVLKNKMDKAIDALEKICPPAADSSCPQEKEGTSGRCSCRSSAVFKSGGCKNWCPDSMLCWDCMKLHGEGIFFDPCDRSRIMLCPQRHFAVSFAVNVCVTSNNKSNAGVSLQIINDDQCEELYTIYNQVPVGTRVTMAMGGIIADTLACQTPSSLLLRLVSQNPLTVESAMMNIIEI